jgi:alkane 1-monooxygenase
LINLQRHSDHHKHPQRRYPVLQHYHEADAPQLPFGYPTMLILSLLAPLWFWIMNPRVEDWRRRHYPEGKAA